MGRPIKGPLGGRRIAITRPSDRAAEFVAGVRALGGRPRVYPAIDVSKEVDIQALDAALLRLRDGDWIAITSETIADALAERWKLFRQRHSVGIRLATVGSRSAAALERGWRAPDFVPARHDTASLGAALPVRPGAVVLNPTSDLGGAILRTALAERGVAVDTVPLYRTTRGPGLARLALDVGDRAVDAVLFASASAARFTIEAVTALGAPSAWPPIFCIGKATADEVARAGLVAQGIADVPSAQGLVDVAVRWFGEAPR